MSDQSETSITVEVVYRGIFQKTLAQRICRSIVLAARKRGHTGTAFARYGDSPERNGVPAKMANDPVHARSLLVPLVLRALRRLGSPSWDAKSCKDVADPSRFAHPMCPGAKGAPGPTGPAD